VVLLDEVGELEHAERPAEAEEGEHASEVGVEGHPGAVPPPRRPRTGMAAWKTIVWEGRLAMGRRLLILGATGASGRMGTQIAIALGAVAAGGIGLEIETVPLAEVEDAWARPGGGRRLVLVP
jgi:hypothetical protein